MVGGAGDRRRHRAHRDPGAHRRGARRRQPGARHPGRPAPGAGWRPRAGPSSRAEFALLGQAVTGALAAADTPGDVRRAARPAAAPARGARVAVRRVRRLPRRARRQARRGLRGVRRAASRRCSTTAPAAPTGSSTRPSASWPASRRRVADAGLADEVNTYFASDPMVAQAARARRRAAGARRHGPGRRARRAAQGRAAGGRPRAARPRDLFDDGGDDDPARPAPVRGQHPADRADAGAARRRGMALRGHRHRLPRAGTRPGVRRHPSVLGPAAGLRDGRGLPRRVPGRVDLLAEPARWTRCTRRAADGTLRELVRRAAEARYDEGYERGVHDDDARAILDALLRLHAGAGPAALPAGRAGRGAAVLGVRRRRAARRGVVDPAGRVAGPGPGGVRRVAGARRPARPSWPPPSTRSRRRPACRPTTVAGRLPRRGARRRAGRLRHQRRRPCPARRFRRALGGAALEGRARVRGRPAGARRRPGGPAPARARRGWTAYLRSRAAGAADDLDEAVAIELCGPAVDRVTSRRPR